MIANHDPALETTRRYCLRCQLEIDDSLDPGPRYDPWRSRLRAYCGPCRRIIVDQIYRVPSHRHPDPVSREAGRVFVILILLVTIVVMLGYWFPAR